MLEAPSRQELEAAHCWEPDDLVPGPPEMTEFRRALRFHQARWRESKGHPIGTQPIVPREGAPFRLVGSRLPVDYARDTGANFLTADALKAAKARLSAKEPHQTFDRQRLWADLLWSPTMAFNLFGDLASDLALADRAIHIWWPDAPGRVSEVRFAYSPGRLDPAYLGSLITFDAAFVLELADGSKGIIGVATKYHDWAKPEKPKPARLPRYLQVGEKSGAFKPGALETVDGKLVVTWLEHLLVHSMLQHPGGMWSWGGYVVVHPAGNINYRDACARYRKLLKNGSTYSSMTLEALLDAGALPAKPVATLRERYIPD
jgi:PD-(D/E)XK nuclease superfamily protein